jgi:hypothetical protein
MKSLKEDQKYRTDVSSQSTWLLFSLIVSFLDFFSGISSRWIVSISCPREHVGYLSMKSLLMIQRQNDRWTERKTYVVVLRCLQISYWKSLCDTTSAEEINEVQGKREDKVMIEIVDFFCDVVPRSNFIRIESWDEIRNLHHILIISSSSTVVWVCTRKFHVIDLRFEILCLKVIELCLENIFQFLIDLSKQQEMHILKFSTSWVTPSFK